VTLIWEPEVRLGIRCNIWHVRGGARDLLIDSGMGVVPLKAELGGLIRANTLCVATHTHFDHIGGHHEFRERAIHPAEAAILSAPTRKNTAIDIYVDEKTFLSPPHARFDWHDYDIEAAPPTMLLHDGDIIEFGDRRVEVMHLPGHTPGCIALFEAATGILFSGDVIYDGTLYDNLENSSIPDYRRSMRRLRDLPVTIVHGGHRESFGRDRMIEIIDSYLAKTDGQG
jgi:glyoxylase-like metal-dependent hydrolase (beta-lactamase superfamily II)